jgi:hypothetical protein
MQFRMVPSKDIDSELSKKLSKGDRLRYRMGIPPNADKRTRTATAEYFFAEARRLCGMDLSQTFTWYVLHGHALRMIQSKFASKTQFHTQPCI